MPLGATIHKAELTLTLSSTPSSDPFQLELREAGAAWVRPPSPGTISPRSAPATGSASYHSDVGVVRIDVTALATRWATGTISTPAWSCCRLSMRPTWHSPAAKAQLAPPASRRRLVISCTPTEGAAAIDQAAPISARRPASRGYKQASRNPAIIQIDQGALKLADILVPFTSKSGNDPLAHAQWFLRSYSDTLRLSDPDQEFQLTRRSQDGKHLFFRQRHNGIPVFPATLGVHMDNQNIRGVGGSYVPDITTPSTPRLTAQQAEQLATALFGDGSVRPGDGSVKPGDGSVRPLIKGETQLRYLNLGLLGQADKNTYLTWRVNVVEPEWPFRAIHRRIHRRGALQADAGGR